MSNTKDFIGITVDPFIITSILMMDPYTAERVKDAVRASLTGVSDVKHTALIGAANLNGGDGDDGDFYSFFVSTQREKSPGEEGFFYRNKNRETGQLGSRVQFRLKKQKKNFASTSTGEQAQAAQSPGQKLPAGVSPMDLAKALAVLQGAGLLQGQPVEAQKTEAQQAADDILDLL